MIQVRRQYGRPARGGRFALLVLLVGAACGEDPEGREAYVESGCPRCHGSDLQGTRLGPSLNGLNAHWDREGLTAFLARPDSFRTSDQRLELVAQQFPSPMPTFVMPDTLRAQLVTYLRSVD